MGKINLWTGFTLHYIYHGKIHKKKPEGHGTHGNVTEWIYETNADDTSRFVLGTVGTNPLICFGIHPSTATTEVSDKTMAKLRGFAESDGFDSYIMLNLYPQRGDLPACSSPDLISTNNLIIADVVQRLTGNGNKKVKLWAAWGEGICKPYHGYITKCLRDIVALPELQNCEWVSRGDLTKEGHPRNPLFLANKSVVAPFDMKKYLNKL